MVMTLEQFSTEMLALPSKSRALLAKKLLESLDPDPDETAELEALWAAEAERRYQEILDGSAVTRPADQVMRDIRATFKD